MFTQAIPALSPTFLSSYRWGAAVNRHAQMHRNAQTHTYFSAHSAMGAASSSRDLGQGFGSSNTLCAAGSAWPAPTAPPQGLSSTSRAAWPLPAAHQCVGEWKTGLKLTLLCCIFLLIGTLPFISERFTVFDLLQHLLSHIQLLGNFFRAQLLLNCVVFNLATNFCGKKEQMVNPAWLQRSKYCGALLLLWLQIMLMAKESFSQLCSSWLLCLIQF